MFYIFLFESITIQSVDCPLAYIAKTVIQQTAIFAKNTHGQVRAITNIVFSKYYSQ